MGRGDTAEVRDGATGTKKREKDRPRPGGREGERSRVYKCVYMLERERARVEGEEERREGEKRAREREREREESNHPWNTLFCRVSNSALDSVSFSFSVSGFDDPDATSVPTLGKRDSTLN